MVVIFADRLAPEVHGACAVQARAAPEFGPRQMKMITQDPQKRCFAIDGNGLDLTVHGHCRSPC
jgi:hypothetical protein